MRRSTQFLFAACCLLLALSGCKGEQEHPAQAARESHKTVKAAVAEAKMTDEPVFHEAVGTVRAEATGVIAARTMGTVISFKVREGD
ncbi:efflux RND transporter periplasmic adaptor subunit, partial [Desulfobulbus sp. F5]|nr:efflux RND transporter periplasmic adaptor subunit [Desulfobulbus sp. F5]